MKNHNKPNKLKFHESSVKRRDIRNLLQAYSGAIALDQFKVDALPRKHFHPYYRRGLWVIWRQSHLSFIDKLVATTGAMPRKLLSDLTLLAARRDPQIVRETMVEILGQGAAESLAPGYIDTATLFFQALVVSVGDGSFDPGKYRNCKHCKARMTRWLALTDPLSIAEDPECGYLAALQRALENRFPRPGIE
jgi:hypothetical protein